MRAPSPPPPPPPRPPLPPSVSELRTLLGDAEALGRACTAEFPRHFERHFTAAEVPGAGGRRVLVTPHGRVSGEGSPTGEYLDPAIRSVVAFDHIAGMARGERPAVGSEGGPAPESRLGILRAALERRFLAYARDAHPGATVAVYAREAGVGGTAGEGTLVVCVGALEVSKQNFWQGHSRSEWCLDLDRELHVAACSGECSVCVMSFEDGSVQMDFAQQYSGVSAPSEVHDPDPVEAASAACLAVIEAHERAFLEKLEGHFEDFDAVFKDLRRALPVSRTKFNWNAGVHRMAGQLKAREQKLSGATAAEASGGQN